MTAASTNLDDLREHGRRVVAEVRASQRRRAAAKVPDTRTDDEVRAAYAAAMAAKTGARK